MKVFKDKYSKYLYSMENEDRENNTEKVSINIFKNIIHATLSITTPELLVCYVVLKFSYLHTSQGDTQNKNNLLRKD